MNNEITPINEQTIIPTTEVQDRVDTMLANRTYLIEKVKPLLIPNVDIYELPGMKKPSLGKPGAEKLAAIFGLVASFSIDKDTMAMIGEKAGGKPYMAYVCDLTRNGQFVGQGRGATFIEWERTQYKNVKPDEFEKIRETLKPEDYKQAKSEYGVYYRIKDGSVFDNLALNKAIKMAQKSAFVDAVIRATGMSDLFTQDVEDMPQDEVSKASEEPFEGRANYEKQDVNMKVCSKCGKEHQGKYAKCWDCWNAEKSNT